MKKMNGFIAAAVCTGLLAGFGAMTFSARAAENETADIPEATEEYTGTLPVASEIAVTTVTASDENSELEELRSKGQRAAGEYIRQEKILLGELAPDAPRITLDEAEDIISGGGTVYEIMERFNSIHGYPDFLGGSGITRAEYWLGEDDSSMLLMYIEEPKIWFIDENGELTAYRLDSDRGIAGDANGDGFFNISDVVAVQKWLLGREDISFPDWHSADVNSDGKVDIFDLCAMKRMLISDLF